MGSDREFAELETDQRPSLHPARQEQFTGNTHGTCRSKRAFLRSLPLAKHNLLSEQVRGQEGERTVRALLHLPRLQKTDRKF